MLDNAHVTRLTGRRMSFVHSIHCFDSIEPDQLDQKDAAQVGRAQERDRDQRKGNKIRDATQNTCNA